MASSCDIFLGFVFKGHANANPVGPRSIIIGAQEQICSTGTGSVPLGCFRLLVACASWLLFLGGCVAGLCALAVEL